MRVTATFRAPRRAPWLQVLKSAVAAVLAWELAGWLISGPPPIFAAIAALLVVQSSLSQSPVKAIERTVGVVVGVAVAGVLGMVLGNGTWIILLAIVLALLLASSLRMTPGTANQVAISAMLVLALGTETSGYAFDRVVETIIGAVVGFVINMAIVPPVAVAPAYDGVRCLGSEIADALDRLASALTQFQSPDELDELIASARRLHSTRVETLRAIETAVESLTLNPRAGQHPAQLAETQQRLDRLTAMVTQTIGMTRAFFDRYDDTLPQEPTVAAIAQELHRAAVDLRHEIDGDETGARAGVGTAHGPRAASPPVILTPTSNHWELLGSLLVDLRRIQDGLTDTAE